MLSQKIRALRKERGYSQEQMARKLNVTQGAISQWENGLTVPSMEQLVSLSSIFGISVDSLLDTAKAEEPKPQNQLNKALVDMLISLSPDQVQRVKDFVAGMKATEKAGAFDPHSM